MTPEQRADIEQRLADVEEATEQRMHAVADLLPDREQVDERASALSRRAGVHRERAEELRQFRPPDGSGSAAVP
jgi:hypothetical protein